MIEHVHYSISATGEIDGKQITANEDFRRTFWGLGLAWKDRRFGVDTDLRFALGEKFSRFEGSLSWAIARQANMRVRYEYEALTWEGLNVRSQGVSVGVLLEF
jgi:hypothetical protein